MASYGQDAFVYLVVATPLTRHYGSLWEELLSETILGGWCVARALGGLTSNPNSNCIEGSVPHLAFFTSTTDWVVIDASRSSIVPRKAVCWPIVAYHHGRIAYFGTSFRPGRDGKCQGCRLLDVLAVHLSRGQESGPDIPQEIAYTTLVLFSSFHDGPQGDESSSESFNTMRRVTLYASL